MKLLQSFFTPGNGLASLTLALLHFFNTMDGEREANKASKGECVGQNRSIRHTIKLYDFTHSEPHDIKK